MVPFTRSYRKRPPVILFINGVRHGVDLPPRRPKGRPRTKTPPRPEPPLPLLPVTPWQQLLDGEPFRSWSLIEIATLTGTDADTVQGWKHGAIPSRSAALLLLAVHRRPLLAKGTIDLAIREWSEQGEALPPVEVPPPAPISRQLTRQEKKKLVVSCLAEEPKISSRGLARRLGISRRFVDSVKKTVQEGQTGAWE